MLKPTGMTLAEVEKALGEAARIFYMHKFKNLSALSPWKQEFMLAVFKILVNNSYLAKQMHGLVTENGMPQEIKSILHAPGVPASGRAPIP